MKRTARGRGGNLQSLGARRHDLLDTDHLTVLIDARHARLRQRLHVVEPANQKTIEDSLCKNLIALYHSRIKYPDSKTAG